MTRRVVFVLLAFVLCGCASAPKEPPPLFKVRNGKLYTADHVRLPMKPLSHASCALAIEGWDEDAVREAFGETPEILRPPSAELMYGQPQETPPADEQWVYARTLEHVVLYFKDGKVVLAVAEWSDW
jgi:hypothetical protein